VDHEVRVLIEFASVTTTFGDEPFASHVVGHTVKHGARLDGLALHPLTELFFKGFEVAVA